MRKIPVELTKRYEHEGWWTHETLGDLIARGLQASPDAGLPGALRRPALRGHLRRRRAARPAGSPPGCARVASAPATWSHSAAELDGSRRDVLGVGIPRRRDRADRALLRPQGTDSHPRHGQAAGVHHRRGVRPDEVSSPTCARTSRSSAWSGPTARAGRHRFDDLLADEPMDGTIAADPASPALIAFTSGTTSNPKGVIHSHQTLGFETRQLLANYPPDRGSQLTATPVGHFIGMLGAFLIPVLEGASIDLCRRLGPGQGAQADRERRPVGRRRPALLRHQPARPSRLHRRAHVRTSRPSASADRRCPRRSPAAGRHRHLRVPLLRQHRAPVDHRLESPIAPEDKRLYTDGNARPGVEIRLGPDGEIISRGPDLCLGYTDPRTDGQGLRRRRLVPHRRRRCARRRRLPDHHRPQGRRHHPRRREHQRARGRGGAAGHAAGGRGRRGGRPRRAARRAGGRGAAAAGRGSDADARRGARPLRGGGRGAAEVARGTARGRRLSAHRERQGAEVSGAARTLR